MACTGEPISWPRLERFALDGRDGDAAAIAAHLAGCPACRCCLEQIRDDAVALPPLAVPSAAAARPVGRRRWLAPVAALAAAAIVVLVVRYRPAAPDGAAVIGVKGIGEVSVELVRERGGQISHDARRYAPADRWKVVVTCAANARAAIDVTVADASSPERPADRPLAAAELACGNRVVVPGAFTITGSADNRVCATVTAPGAPGVPGDAGTACITLRPEQAGR